MGALAARAPHPASLRTATLSRGERVERGGRRELALVVTLTLAITAPFLLFKLGQEEDLLRDYLKHFDLRQACTLLCGYLLDGNAIFPGRPQREHLALAAAPMVLGLLGVAMWRMRSERSGRMVIACFVLPLVFFYIASARIKAVHDDGMHWIYQERNLLILLHPFGLLLMVGAASLPWARLRGPAAGAVLGLGVVGTSLMLTVHADRPTVSMPNPDWRGVARLLEGEAAARGEPVVVFSRVWCEPVLHYTPEPVVHRFRPLAPGYKYVLAYLRRYGAGAFYCVDETNASALSAEEMGRLARWFDTEASWEFGWVRIHRMVPRPGVTERDGPPEAPGGAAGG